MKFTYVGHATTLIEWDGFHFLTDPVFSQRILCFKRYAPLNIDPSQIPPLQAVLLSHAHYDHLDLFSYKYIPQNVPILIPEGMAGAIAPFVNNPVVELSVWSKFSLPGGFEVTAVPAQHFGGRLFPYRYRTCVGYIISKEGKHCYFAGDSAYGEHFKRIQQSFPISFALLPVTFPYNSSLLNRFHMNGENVVRAWEDLGKPDWMPIHWGTFFQGIRNSKQAVEMVVRAVEKNPELKKKFHLVTHGDTYSLLGAPRLKVVNS